MKYTKQKIYFWIFIGILLPLCLLLSYVLIFREMVVLAYQEKSPDWFNTFINYLYPRFWVEKRRFSQEFFLSKTNQIVIRFTLVAWVLSSLMIFKLKSKKFRQKNKQFWNLKVPLHQVTFIKFTFVIVIALFTWDWLWVFRDLAQASAFYQPVFLLKILELPFPSAFLCYFLVLLMWIVAVLLLFPTRKIQVLLASIVAVLFWVLQGYLNSFHKLDHTFATFTYALLLLPLMLYEQVKAQKQDLEVQNAWALQLSRVMISIAYFFTGLEKMLISGFTWFASYNLQFHIEAHQSSFGLWLAQSDFVSSILLIWVVTWELGFPLLLFFQKLKIPILVAGVLFHLGTFLLLGVGGWYSPWWLVYVVFWDINRKPLKNQKVGLDK